MKATNKTKNNDRCRICSSSFFEKHQFKIIIISIFLMISVIIGVTLFIALFHRPSSTDTTILVTSISTKITSKQSHTSTTKPNFQQNINTISSHNISYNAIPDYTPLVIMTFNIQFYSTSMATKPIADFIISHKPDVVCLQENFYISDWNQTGLVALDLSKEYFLASDCQAERLGQKKTHLSNTIYVQHKYVNFTKTLANVNLQITNETPRCSSVIQLYDTKIANLHLCGGRFDDKKFENLPNHKRLQLEKLINTHNPDIILGDFNNENSDEAVMKQLNKYDFYQHLGTARKPKFIEYYTSGTHCLRNYTNYVPAYNETTIGSTSNYGGTPDWVYVKNQTRLTNRIHNYNTTSMKLSDHNAVTVEYLFPKYQNP